MKAIIALTLALATILCYVGPSMDDHSGESTAADTDIAEQKAEIKALRAAIEMCGGENAVAQDLGGGNWQCLTKRGYKTIIAKGFP